MRLVTLFLSSLSIALPLNISFSLFFVFSSSSSTIACFRILPVVPLWNFVHVSLCCSLNSASLCQLAVNNTSVWGIAAWKQFPFYPSKGKNYMWLKATPLVLHTAHHDESYAHISDRSKQHSQLIDAASESYHSIWHAHLLSRVLKQWSRLNAKSSDKLLVLQLHVLFGSVEHDTRWLDYQVILIYGSLGNAFIGITCRTQALY